MMVVICLECGRIQEWKNGVILGESQIEVSQMTVTCSCGHVVVEEEGTLKEYRFDVDSIDAEIRPM